MGSWLKEVEAAYFCDGAPVAECIPEVPPKPKFLLGKRPRADICAVVNKAVSQAKAKNHASCAFELRASSNWESINSEDARDTLTVSDGQRKRRASDIFAYRASRNRFACPEWGKQIAIRGAFLCLIAFILVGDADLSRWTDFKSCSTSDRK
ncbi:hypothetical protein CEXT_661071 [Caerostris extrusa]|uniref:Uncharacterized protein n=1 Tax=Caerostris extrusa TaxID=172846 RepID=A0AAV4NHL6_CAEEX|nr:hypothetical protein CEXT_661071 [Caerostris extrusa]